MATLALKDANGATVYVNVGGSGTVGDPYVVAHSVSNFPASQPVTWLQALNAQDDQVRLGLYNGTTYDDARSTIELTGTQLGFPSAARTTTTNGTDQTNIDGRGVMIYLNISAASGTGGLTLRIQGKEPTGGNYFSLTTVPTTQTAIGPSTYFLYPGAAANSQYTQVVSGPLPRTWRVIVTHGDASSYTYSVSAMVIK